MEMHHKCGYHWFKELTLLVLGILFLMGTLGVIDFTFATWWPISLR